MRVLAHHVEAVEGEEVVRVSDGLMAELRRKMDDGTPRGMVWPVLANIALSVAPCAYTDEEVEMANELLAATILDADDRALGMLTIQYHLAQLQEYLDRKRPAR